MGGGGSRERATAPLHSPGPNAAMRQEMLAKHGIGARIRIAAMPSAMPVAASLTGPFQLRHRRQHRPCRKMPG